MSLTIRSRYQNGPEKIARLSGDEIIIGRPKENLTIQLDLSPDVRVSRPHARLFYDLGTWWVEDFSEAKHHSLHNGQPFSGAAQLASGDRLQIGDTTLRLEFAEVVSDLLPPGMVQSHFLVDEAQPPPAMAEDRRLDILARIMRLITTAQGKPMLDALLNEVIAAFPVAEHASLLLREDKEIVPVAYWSNPPGPGTHISFTLARQAIRTREALRWLRSLAAPGEAVLSLNDTVAALYGPMLYGGQAIGALHVDTTAADAIFSEADLSLLCEIASTAALAIKAGGLEAATELPSVFISYAHKDREFIDRLTADLRRRQVRVWFDERLRGGKPWQAQLATAIENTDALVLVMSQVSVASEYVLWEIETAVSLHKTIFPLMYQESEPPASILPLQYITIGLDYADGLEHLVEELSALKEKKS